mgnify:CR=1 FL=1
MTDFRTLVVGTTADYIAMLGERFPGRVLFVTDKSQAVRRAMPELDSRTQILLDLSVTKRVIRSIERHLEQWNIKLRGVACYDCEWLVLAAEIARHFALEYPSAESVALCRNKMASKQRWLDAGLLCPRASIVSSPQQAAGFASEVNAPVVLKPLSGSGSELTFVCEDPATASRMYQVVDKGLRERIDLPMFMPVVIEGRQSGAPQEIVAEEFVAGSEYSCDVFIDGDEVVIIRFAEKLPRPAPPFGITMAYLVPGRMPDKVSEAELRDILFIAGRSLGLRRSLFMADFIVRNGRVFLLELTPRIGGDCLPYLIKQSCGLDMLGVALDVAEQRPLIVPEAPLWKQLVGLRLFADKGGVIKKMDSSRIEKDRRVQEVYFKRLAGDGITLPPKDYDTWILGHVIFQPDSISNFDLEGGEIAAKLKVRMTRHYDDKKPGRSDEDSRAAQEANTTT